MVFLPALMIGLSPNFKRKVSMRNSLKNGFFLLFILLASMASFGFYLQKAEDFPDKFLGYETNYTNDLGDQSSAGSPLSKIDRIGFWGSYPFCDDEKKQAELLLWMKSRFEEVGHCIVLDQIDGIDFTPIAKGGHALMGGWGIRIDNLKEKISFKLEGVQYIYLDIMGSINYTDTGKRGSLRIWSQKMIVDSSDEESLMLGYKELVNNLISDIQETNKNYEKYVPVFYITIDTEFKPYLKEVLGKYVSPPLTVIPANER